MPHASHLRKCAPHRTGITQGPMTGLVWFVKGLSALMAALAVIYVIVKGLRGR